MKPLVRNILSIPAGFILGSIVNMTFIMVGSSVIPAPGGADVTSMEGLKATMHLFEPQHFLFPFLAHALGTLSGAIVAGAVAASYTNRFALAIGVCFLLGGIANIFLIGGPMWFTVADLVGAYLPMGYFGGRIVARIRATTNAQTLQS